MYEHRSPTQNATVARHMRGFFRELTGAQRVNPESVAISYGHYMWGRGETNRGAGADDSKKPERPRFYVCLSAHCDFADLTKRTVLALDTLTLTHAPDEKYFHLDGISCGEHVREKTLITFHPFRGPSIHVLENYGMCCPDMAALGRWILDAEPLLKAGLAWYLPRYAFGPTEERNQPCPLDTEAHSLKAVDYLLKDGRAVDVSGAEPIKSQLVRPILRIELPFIEGVSLEDFSRITVGEFNSFSGFRNYMRTRLLDIEDQIQSDRELLKIGVEIEEEIRSIHSEMKQTRRSRALAATGAAIGTTTAMLVAVYGPALRDAVAVLGATGGVWTFINALANNASRQLRDDKWYYAWALSRQVNTESS